MSLEGEPSVRSFLPLSYSFGDPSDDEERRGDDLVGSAEGYTWSKHWVPECVHSQA